MQHPSHELNSKLAGFRWPAVVQPLSAHLVTLLYQLDQSQWFDAPRLREHQFRQLAELLAHAVKTVPYYKQRFAEIDWRPGDPLTNEVWQSLPLLRRADIQESFQALRSRNIPAAHGKQTEMKSSGSTGQPVQVVTTEAAQLLWHAVTLRFHLWHRHDFSARLCAIRAGHGPLKPEPSRRDDWGPPIDLLFASGPASMMDCRNDVGALVDWAHREQPAYLIGLPSTLVAMADICRQKDVRLDGLRQVITYAETLDAAKRQALQQAWGAPVADMYSCQEAGYIALQCPEHDHYHVQGENVLLEVLDDEGRPCGPGQVGRVVITALHNFATPLIRYELLDYVELGEPCPCGRGLPVIHTIKGRQRNLITLPDGRRFWPVLYASAWSGIAPIRQLQLIQKTPEHFDARVVIDRDLTDAEQAALARAIGESLGYPFKFRFLVQRERLASATGKVESIVSEVGLAPAGATG